jgi:serine/threonine protein kinase
LYLGEYGGRRVAIRMPATADPAESERLGNEARQVAGLSNPHIVPHEVGLQDDRLFLASDLVAGESLENWLTKTHSLADQLRVVDGIASALSYVHEQGVLHRALKPANIQVGSDGEPRLMSFGLGSSSSALGDAAPDYGAPEVLEGMPDNAQSDIYSAGVVFYEILSGRGPATEDGPVVKPLRDLRPDLSKDLADAIMACRERSPDWRPKDLSYLLEVVRRARGTAGPTTARPAAAARPAAPTPRPAQAGETARPAPTFGARRPARSPVPILAAIGVVVLGGAAAWFLTQSSSSGGSAPAATVPAATTPATEATPPPVSSTPSPVPTPSPVKTAAATPAPEPSGPRPQPTPAPPTPAPTHATEVALPTPPPTLAPAPTPTPLPTPPPKVEAVETAPADAAAAPAVLTAVSPPSLRRGARTLVDVRGTGLRSSMQASLAKGRAPADALRVVNQRFVNSTLIQVFVEVDAGAPPGAYALSLADGQGATNGARFEVAK